MLQCTGTDDDDPSTFHSSPKLFHDVISSSQCVTKRHPERWLSAYPRSIEPERSAGRCRYRYSCTCRHAQATIPPSSLRWVVCTRPAHPPSLAAKAFSGLGPRPFALHSGTHPLFLASPRLSPRQAQDVLGAGVGRLTSWNWLPPALRSIFSFGGVYWYPVS